LGSAAAAGGSPFGQGIRDRFPDGLVNQGVSAELIARRWGLSRFQLDEFAALSHQRASEAAARGDFDTEVLPVTIADGNGTEALFSRDETVRASTTVDALAGLAPAFRTDDYASRFPELE